MLRSFSLTVALLAMVSCSREKKKEADNNMPQSNTLSDQSQNISDYVIKNAVIAHRGTEYWAPEETEPAFRWARNIGADYLELDLQMTKDSVLIALHDDDLSRTTNVADVFPERVNLSTLNFTLKELRSLDAGSWFNKANPDRARTSYAGLEILTFKDVVMIAEGYRLKRKDNEPVKELLNNVWSGQYLYEQDPKDNGNRPGISAETKKPEFEEILASDLTDLGWNINSGAKDIDTVSGKVGIANTRGRLILQSFSMKSILSFEEVLPNIPKCYLIEIPQFKHDVRTSYQEAIDFAISTNVNFIGPSIAGEPNNYYELTAPWMIDLIHSSGLNIHPYTFDTNDQLVKYASTVDGVFTNRADLALSYYKRGKIEVAVNVLDFLGY